MLGPGGSRSIGGHGQDENWLRSIPHSSHGKGLTAESLCWLTRSQEKLELAPHMASLSPALIGKQHPMASTHRLAGLRPYSRCPGLRDHVKLDRGRRERQPEDTLIWFMSMLPNNHQVLVR